MYGCSECKLLECPLMIGLFVELSSYGRGLLHVQVVKSLQGFYFQLIMKSQNGFYFQRKEGSELSETVETLSLSFSDMRKL